MPTPANHRSRLDISYLRWTHPIGKPQQPKGFYWQASGSKTEQIGKGKRISVGWTLIKNGKCQTCGDRYRPPVAYLKGQAWTTLQGESDERQRAEIKAILGKSRGKINSLRCPECVSRLYVPLPVAGESR